MLFRNPLPSIQDMFQKYHVFLLWKIWHVKKRWKEKVKIEISEKRGYICLSKYDLCYSIKSKVKCKGGNITVARLCHSAQTLGDPGVRVFIYLLCCLILSRLGCRYFCSVSRASRGPHAVPSQGAIVNGSVRLSSK